MKEKMTTEFLRRIHENFDPEELDLIRGALLIALEDYELTSASKELTVVEESDEKTFQMFLIAKKVEGCTDRTIQYYHNELRKFLMEARKPLKEIDSNDIRLYVAKKAMIDHVSAVTQDNVLRILRTFFAWLTAEEYIERNPTLKIKKIKVEKRVKKAFSDLEVEKLRSAARDKREKAIIDVLLSTGMRVGELHLLNRSDIDGDTAIVYGKGKKERYVYLNAKAQVSIEEYLKERDDDNEALFVSERSPHNRLNIRGFEEQMRTLGRKTGIKDVHPHRFRRTAATQALNRGMPIEQVRQMLGHESIETTLIYAQSAQENVKASHKKYVT